MQYFNISVLLQVTPMTQLYDDIQMELKTI